MMEVVVHSDDLAHSVNVPTPSFPPEVEEPVLSLLTQLAVRRHGFVAVGARIDPRRTSAGVDRRLLRPIAAETARPVRTSAPNATPNPTAVPDAGKVAARTATKTTEPGIELSAPRTSAIAAAEPSPRCVAGASTVRITGIVARTPARCGPST
jgi:hypothetical protein